MDDEVGLLGLGAVILRRWRIVIGAVIAVMAAALVLRLLMPPTFTARTVVVPATVQSAGGTRLLASQLAGLPGMIGAAADPNQRLIISILRSRSLADSVVHRLTSEGGGNEVDPAEIREILRDEMQIESSADGSMEIAVGSGSPATAVAIANSLPVLANGILSQLGVEAALRQQAFLEKQLVGARVELERSEQMLLAFQEGKDAPELQGQASRTIDAAAELQQGIIQKEIQVAQLRRTTTPDNPQLRAAIAELGDRREQLRRLTTGGRGGSQFFLSLSESPELRVETTRLLREYTKNEQVYLSLTSALAEAQIDVNNNLPTVTVLDPAITPMRPSGVRMEVILLLGGVFGMTIGIVSALLIDYMHNAREKPEHEEFFQAWEQVKADAGKYRRKIGRRVMKTTADR